MIETKLCRPCGHSHPATDEFFSRRRSGTFQECRMVIRRRARGWHDSHRDEHNTLMRMYASENREAAAARSRLYYEEHRDELIERARCWAEDNRQQYLKLHNQKEHRRRAAKCGVEAEDVDRDVVYDQSGGICGICYEPVGKDGFHLDHVVPLSKGGPHTYANVQAAHPSCNLAKSDRLDFSLILAAGGENDAV